VHQLSEAGVLLVQRQKRSVASSLAASQWWGGQR
jgi:hypothetical protein